MTVSEPEAQPETRPGHPVWVMRAENAEAEKTIAQVRDHIGAVYALQAPSAQTADELAGDIALLREALPHYKRKEELLFPHLEAHGAADITKAMWGRDDDIRTYLMMASSLLDGARTSPTPDNLSSVAYQLEDAANAMADVAAREKDTLIPLALDRLTAAEWVQIAQESGEFGYSFIDEPPAYEADATVTDGEAAAGSDVAAGSNVAAGSDVAAGTDVVAGSEAATVPEGAKIHLSTGEFTIAQLEAVFATIPLDLTFVDADDKTRFYSHGDARVFPRPKSCLGRDVYACHPPKSQPMVHKVFEDFRSGERDSYEFWIHRKGRFILIRYFAVRDADGSYLGALETTQDITDIHELKGDNRRGADIRRADA
ncbi:MAG: PAS domain-containing protein [Olegusella sp.]|nr:PAS domain-containing protein [Olegusella sp.]